MKYVASCSCGKDSLAMVLKIIEKKKPLDEVIFYDTGVEFQSIYINWKKLCSILDQHGIKHTVLKPDLPFLYEAFERPIKYKNKPGYHYGYSWCGGACRWGTGNKIMRMTKYIGNNITYVGIAFDEMHRIKSNPNKRYPLIEFKMTEKDCLDYCYANGFNWIEPDCNNIDLYAILDRVSCWCCSNKNLKELRNIYLYLPLYWNKLKEFQSRTDRPMKNYKRKGVPCGSVYDLEKRFENEIEEQDI